MKQAKISFFMCIQDSQEFGSDDEYMVSRVFFNMEIDGELKTDLYSNIKQTVGSNFEEGQIEVGFPVGITGPFNYEKFSDAAKKYYLKLVGSQGSGIKIGNGCSNIRMMHNIFKFPYNVEFEIPESGTSW